jgi:hypothetical protein
LDVDEGRHDLAIFTVGNLADYLLAFLAGPTSP